MTGKDKDNHKEAHKDKESPRKPRESVRSEPPAAGPTPQRAAASRWLDALTSASADKGLTEVRREFMQLRKYRPPGATADACRKAANGKKNRNGDVECGDASRVKLDGRTDYIHASHVSSGLGTKLILTQAPTERTVNDFWRMVWQQRVRTVIMLCEQEERGGKFKCGHYWPAEGGKPVATGAYSVAFERGEVVALNDDEVVHKSTVRVTRSTNGKRKVQEADGGKGEDETRSVERLRWAHWPAGNVPGSAAAMVYVNERIKASAAEADAPPVLVHCTAGVGRSGALALYALALERIGAGQPLHMAELLKQLRHMRLHAVQSERQYLYVHRCLVEHLSDALLATMSRHVVAFFIFYEIFIAKPVEGKNKSASDRVG